MAKFWTDDDQIYLLQNISSYRSLINDKEQEEARKITRAFAKYLHQQTPELHHRTVEAITQRLPYLDNLLAGVWEEKNYAKKDRALYYAQPRPSMNDEPNLCNTRHSYNGMLR